MPFVTIRGKKEWSNVPWFICPPPKWKEKKKLVRYVLFIMECFLSFWVEKTKQMLCLFFIACVVLICCSVLIIYFFKNFKTVLYVYFKFFFVLSVYIKYFQIIILLMFKVLFDYTFNNDFYLFIFFMLSFYIVPIFRKHL